MFDVPPSGRKGNRSTLTATPTVPNIVLNIPDMLASHHPHQSLCWSWSPQIASDPADYNDHEFLCDLQARDRHGQDLISNELMLCEEEILGPDDITR